MSKPIRLVFPVLAGLILAACASNRSPYLDPCAAMREQVKEMQALEKDMKGLTKQVNAWKAAGDTAGVALAERRLEGMRENRRALQASLEQSADNCSPTMKNMEPVRDPARRIEN